MYKIISRFIRPNLLNDDLEVGVVWITSASKFKTTVLIKEESISDITTIPSDTGTPVPYEVLMDIADYSKLAIYNRNLMRPRPIDMG